MRLAPTFAETSSVPVLLDESAAWHRRTLRWPRLLARWTGLTAIHLIGSPRLLPLSVVCRLAPRQSVRGLAGVAGWVAESGRRPERCLWTAQVTTG